LFLQNMRKIAALRAKPIAVRVLVPVTHSSIRQIRFEISKRISGFWFNDGEPSHLGVWSWGVEGWGK